jgi:hypothetical protein
MSLYHRLWTLLTRHDFEGVSDMVSFHHSSGNRLIVFCTLIRHLQLRVIELSRTSCDRYDDTAKRIGFFGGGLWAQDNAVIDLQLSEGQSAVHPPVVDITFGVEMIDASHVVLGTESSQFISRQHPHGSLLTVNCAANLNFRAALEVKFQRDIDDDKEELSGRFLDVRLPVDLVFLVESMRIFEFVTMNELSIRHTDTDSSFVNHICVGMVVELVV